MPLREPTPRAIAHIYIVPEGGLGLCSEGINSLADEGGWETCDADSSAHIYIVPEGGLGLCSEGIYSLATRRVGNL